MLAPTSGTANREPEPRDDVSICEERLANRRADAREPSIPSKAGAVTGRTDKATQQHQRDRVADGASTFAVNSVFANRAATKSEAIAVHLLTGRCRGRGGPTRTAVSTHTVSLERDGPEGAVAAHAAPVDGAGLGPDISSG